MTRVEAIFAVSTNRVIGQGEGMPWHHAGDFQHFKNTTMGHGILIGYPTFSGLARKYTKAGCQVLPGRTIFVLSRVPVEKTLDIDYSNVVIIEMSGVLTDVECALNQLDSHQTLFIAGGARVLARYITLADTVHITLIDMVCVVDEHTVMLNRFETANFASITANREEIDARGLKASYFTLKRFTNDHKNHIHPNSRLS